MKREIKFKYIFENHAPVIYTQHEIETGLLLTAMQKGFGYVKAKLQYIGKKDKNGIEIHEGDIVEIYDWNYNGEQKLLGTSVIEFDPDNGCWQTEKTIVEDQYDFYTKANFVVIGNKYENPELNDTLQ